MIFADTHLKRGNKKSKLIQNLNKISGFTKNEGNDTSVKRQISNIRKLVAKILGCI